MRVLGGMILLFVPFVIFGQLLPLLVFLVPLIFLIALRQVYLRVWAERRQRRRWKSFTVDHECWASPGPDQRSDGAIKLDLSHRWVAFDLNPHQSPRCFTASSIRSCRLIGENCVEMTVRGVAYPFQAYPNAVDAKQMVEAIELLRRLPADVAAARVSEISFSR